MSRTIIQSFPWENAPPEFKALSSAGDEDWVVVFPKALLSTYHYHPVFSGCLDGSRIRQYPHPSDSHYSVFIGSRAPEGA